jgi:hypothetical protein
MCPVLNASGHPDLHLWQELATKGRPEMETMVSGERTVRFEVEVISPRVLSGYNIFME